MFASRASLAVEFASMTSIWWFNVLILGSFTELLVPNRFIGPSFALVEPTRIRGNSERETAAALGGHSRTLDQATSIAMNASQHSQFAHHGVSRSERMSRTPVSRRQRRDATRLGVAAACLFSFRGRLWCLAAR